MLRETDGTGNAYIESKLSNDEAVRVTFIEEGWTGDNCARINIRQKIIRLDLVLKFRLRMLLKLFQL